MADGDELYGRVLIVNIDGREIITVTGTDFNKITGRETAGLRMAFRIEKSLKPAPNQAELRIWNLSEESRKLLVKDAAVSIEAGYGSETAVIFFGDMKKIDHLRDGPDWITHLRIGDGEKQIKKARVNTSFKPGSNPLQVVQQIAETLGLPVKSALDKAKQGDLKGALKQFSAGYVAAGRSWDELVKAGTMMGYDVSIQNGEALFLGPDETDGPTAVVLDVESGLVGSPEQAESSGEKNKHTIIKAKALLNGRGLAPGRAVDLRSKSFNGFTRVEKVTMIGDTHGQDWTCDLELKGLEQNQPGFSFEEGEL